MSNVVNLQGAVVDANLESDRRPILQRAFPFRSLAAGADLMI